MTDIASEADVLRKRLSDMGQRCSELEAERDTALMDRIMADGEIARLRVDVSRLTEERDEARGLAVKHVRTVERLRVDGIHSCHDECPRIACVQRREIDRLRADRDRWYRRAVALGHPSWEDADAARAAARATDSREDGNG